MTQSKPIGTVQVFLHKDLNHLLNGESITIYDERKTLKEDQIQMFKQQVSALSDMLIINKLRPEYTPTKENPIQPIELNSGPRTKINIRSAQTDEYENDNFRVEMKNIEVNHVSMMPHKRIL